MLKWRMRSNMLVKFILRLTPALLCFALCFGCAAAQTPQDAAAPAAIETAEPTAAPSAVPSPTPQPKTQLRYIFCFIGDGMGQNQVLAVSEALAASGRETLSFLDFPVRAFVRTDNVDKKTTDSAAAATAIATGSKTSEGRLGLSQTDRRLTSIAELLRDEGRKIGILTSVSLDHATPAGFYAHVASRRDYTSIGDDLFASQFDFFFGGAFHFPFEGALELAAENGYHIARTFDEAAAAPAESNLVFASDALIGDYGLVPALDAGAREGLLARSLSLCIERLTSQNGFFIMTEGGRIDYFCHYHDAGSMAAELIDMNKAVQTALDFYRVHPSETLILVTADHETGDVSLAQGDRAALLKQRMACDTFDDVYADVWIAERPDFSDVLPVCLDAFGLSDPTQAEVDYLKEAYRHTIKQDLSASEAKKQYGVYEPITSALATLVAKRAGVTFGSGSHTSADVALYALGVGSEFFMDTYENTAIHERLLAALEAYPLE